MTASCTLTDGTVVQLPLRRRCKGCQQIVDATADGNVGMHLLQGEERYPDPMRCAHAWWPGELLGGDEVEVSP